MAIEVHRVASDLVRWLTDLRRRTWRPASRLARATPDPGRVRREGERTRGVGWRSASVTRSCHVGSRWRWRRLGRRRVRWSTVGEPRASHPTSTQWALALAMMCFLAGCAERSDSKRPGESGPAPDPTRLPVAAVEHVPLT